MVTTRGSIPSTFDPKMGKTPAKKAKKKRNKQKIKDGNNASKK